MIGRLSASVLLLLLVLLIHTGKTQAAGKGKGQYQDQCLGVSTPSERFLAKSDLPTCQGGTDDMWFNFEAKVEKVSENCDSEDAFIIGSLLSEVIRQIECSIPEYKQEIFTSELCELPKEYQANRKLALVDEQTNRELGSNSYTYKGGGRCARCKKRRRRSLRDLKEVSVDAVCAFAASANLSAAIATRFMEAANINYEQVIELASDYWDAKKGLKTVEDAEKEMEECAEHEELAKDESLVTQAWCDKAKKQTSYKDLDKSIKYAEKARKNAIEEAEKAAKSMYKIRGLKYKLVQEEAKHEAEEEKDRTKETIEKMKVDMEKQLDVMKDNLDRLKKIISKEKDSKKKAAYEQQMTILETDMKRMEEESKAATKLLEEEAKLEGKAEVLRVELRAAGDEGDWLKKFGKLVEMEAPMQLLHYWNTTTGGCLTDYPEVKVECWPVERSDETKPLEECDIDFDW
jgi:DNA repair exonuclease SbcCD ATPase subunit